MSTETTTASSGTTDRAEGFEDFARSRAPGLYRSAWLLCGDRHTAEDLVQETLAKVYVRWHARFKARIDNPAAYAQTTLTRTFLSSKRKRMGTELPYADPPDRPDRPAGSGDSTADDVERRTDLYHLLAGLGPVDRAVLVLRYLEDLSVEETADRLDLTSGAVRNRAMRALSTLRSESDAADRATTDENERTTP